MSGTVRIAACIVAAAAAGCAAKHHVTPGTPGSWLVATNTSVWYQPDGPDGGFGWAVLAGKAVLPNLIVGARGSALAVLKIRLFDDDEDTTQSNHFDVGPIIGTAAGWGRLVGIRDGRTARHAHHAQRSDAMDRRPRARRWNCSSHPWCGRAWHSRILEHQRPGDRARGRCAPGGVVQPRSRAVIPPRLVSSRQRVHE